MHFALKLVSTCKDHPFGGGSVDRIVVGGNECALQAVGSLVRPVYVLYKATRNIWCEGLHILYISHNLRIRYHSGATTYLGLRLQ